MLFTELRFLPFFLAVFAVHWILRGSTARKVWLLLASYAFYAAWDWRFLSLIAISTLVDFVVALRVGAQAGAGGRKWLWLSLSVNLGLLGFFKYFGFFVDSAVDFTEALGLPLRRPVLDIVLPVGISFYTFQTLSYTIDVYRGRLEPRRNLLDVALFVAFFPQLVAGPIVRAAEFLPQLDRERRFRDVDVRAALVLFLVGFFKKACVSDNLAPWIDAYFAAPNAYDGFSAWCATLGYAAQIYCDFSGYSDMAIATAALLGYRLCLNFDFPYFSRNVTEFWRRWHISLSTWLRDYLYIPLGGGRGAPGLVLRNLMVTMLLGGLWHGASWNFVVWGGLHGIALCAQRVWRAARRIPRRAPGPIWGVPLTFGFVCLTWVFFRSSDLVGAWGTVRSMLLLEPGERHLDPRVLLALGALALIHAARWRGLGTRWWRDGPAWAFSAGYALAVALVVPWVSLEYDPFIYFQF